MSQFVQYLLDKIISKYFHMIWESVVCDPNKQIKETKEAQTKYRHQSRECLKKGNISRTDQKTFCQIQISSRDIFKYCYCYHYTPKKIV